MHLIEELPDFLEVGKMSAIRIQCTFSLCAFRKRIDEQLSNTARMHLEVQLARDGILPELIL